MLNPSYMLNVVIRKKRIVEIILILIERAIFLEVLDFKLSSMGGSSEEFLGKRKDSRAQDAVVQFFWRVAGP